MELDIIFLNNKKIDHIFKSIKNSNETIEHEPWAIVENLWTSMLIAQGSSNCASCICISKGGIEIVRVRVVLV